MSALTSTRSVRSATTIWILNTVYFNAYSIMPNRSELFESAITKVLKDEGGYVNHKNDKGGETAFGISKRSYPDVDIKTLTLEKAKDIYYNDFWKTGPYDALVCAPLAEKVFNTAVNAGNSRAFKLLQQAANACGASVVVDGAIGPKTIAAVNSLDGTQVLAAYRVQQANFYKSLVARDASQAVFLKGWLARAAS